jgi:hypothetical protein
MIEALIWDYGGVLVHEDPTDRAWMAASSGLLSRHTGIP